MYQCINNEGQVVATYANYSECKSYFDHSYPGCKYDEETRPGEVTVFDATNNEVGSIRLPKSKPE